MINIGKIKKFKYLKSAQKYARKFKGKVIIFTTVKENYLVFPITPCLNLNQA